MDESGPGEISRNNSRSPKEGVVGGTRHLTKKGEPLDHSRRVTTASWQSVSSDFSSSVTNWLHTFNIEEQLGKVIKAGKFPYSNPKIG